MTTENKQPKKMGRPPKPGGPVSNKERQQAWRNRQKALKLGKKPSIAAPL